MGGPSGGCIRRNFSTCPSITIPSRLSERSWVRGGMVVMDENTCMVEIAPVLSLLYRGRILWAVCRPAASHSPNAANLDANHQGRRDHGGFGPAGTYCPPGEEDQPLRTGTNLFESRALDFASFQKRIRAHIVSKRCPAGVCDALVLAPCQHACPAGIDVPAYVAFIGQGDYAKAVEVIRDHNPFPAICGRICHHPCEKQVPPRGEVDQPVSIRYLKRFAADWFYEKLQGRPRAFPHHKETERGSSGSRSSRADLRILPCRDGLQNDGF